jgi:hypothetical protein
VSILGRCRSVRLLMLWQTFTVTCSRYVFLAPVLSFFRSDRRGVRGNTASWAEDPSGQPGMADSVTRGQNGNLFWPTSTYPTLLLRLCPSLSGDRGGNPALKI